MKPEFRLATEADLPDIIALTNECFDENTPLAYAQQVWQQTAQDPNVIYLNGYLDGQLVAHLRIAIIATIYEDMGTYAILNHVCVKPDFRRYHLGTQLLDVAFAVCRECGCKAVELWSKNFRQAAHALYQKYGFEVVDAKFFSKALES